MVVEKSIGQTAPASALRRRGILGLKWGFNPNSSSLAADVGVLMLGTVALSLLAAFVSSVIRLRARFGRNRSGSDDPRELGRP